MNDLIVWMGARFSPEAYLFWTRIQCLLWTAADFVIVIYLTRLANLARKTLGVAPHRMPYVILALTAVPAPLVAVVPTGMQVFLIELVVTVPHFLLILYILAANARYAPMALTRWTAPPRTRRNREDKPGNAGPHEGARETETG